MKNILSLILFAILSIISFGQSKPDTSKHLSFRGVPINGTLTEYVSKMKNNGFTNVQTEDGAPILEGDFASYKNCSVRVSTLKQKDLVSNIVVMFPDCDNWASLSSNYFNLKELLTEKYGNPLESEEKFLNSVPDFDGAKMSSVRLGSCKYYTKYGTEKGTIQLTIDHNSKRACFVSLTYIDKINNDAIRKDALDDL